MANGLDQISALVLSIRFLLDDLVDNKWLLPCLFLINLPVPVTLTLLATALDVFALGIFVPFITFHAILSSGGKANI